MLQHSSSIPRLEIPRRLHYPVLQGGKYYNQSANSSIPASNDKQGSSNQFLINNLTNFSLITLSIEQNNSVYNHSHG